MINRRRGLFQIVGGGSEEKTYITTTDSADYVVTPILLPDHAKIRVYCYPITLGSMPSDYNFTDFTSNKTFIIRTSGDRVQYNYYGNDWNVGVTGLSGKQISGFEIDKDASQLTVYHPDGTSTSAVATRSFPTRTTAFRVRLGSSWLVEKVVQLGENDAIVHELIPSTDSGEACFLDSVTGNYYHGTGGNAYLVNL